MTQPAGSRLIDIDTTILSQLSPLGTSQLGDVLQMPDGRALTIRAVAAFPSPVSTMAGFVLLGECEMLVSAPSRRAVPHTVYLPVSELPAVAQRARVAVEGVLSYWAPHLPSLKGAMGELPFRVLDVPGSVDPWVVVYRGPEMIVFVPGGQLDAEQLKVLRMPRQHGDEQYDVVRHVAILEPVPVHIPVAVPVAVPVGEPVSVPLTR